MFWCAKSVRPGRSYPDQRLYTSAVAMIDFRLNHSSRITPPESFVSPMINDWMFETGGESLNLPEYYTVVSIVAEGK